METRGDLVSAVQLAAAIGWSSPVPNNLQTSTLFDAVLSAPRRATDMSKRLDPSWIVMESIENPQHDRCVDVFVRPDGSFGFEEFRRDVEDSGAWTPVSYFSGLRQASKGEALAEAARRVVWLGVATS